MFGGHAAGPVWLDGVLVMADSRASGSPVRRSPSLGDSAAVRCAGRHARAAVFDGTFVREEVRRLRDEAVQMFVGSLIGTPNERAAAIGQPR